MNTIRLSEVALARSGDKGNHANIGVVALNRAGYELLVRELTSERVAAASTLHCVGSRSRASAPL